MRHLRLRPLSLQLTESHTCAHPECRKKFSGAPWLGIRNGLPYCTRFCRDDMSQEPKPEDLARSVG